MSHHIPSTEIERYSRGPSQTTTSSVAAFQNAIRDALGNTYETFLQGSYKNDTSIRDINDVDIVALRKTVVSGKFSKEHVEVSVPWPQLFSDVEAKLEASPRFRGKVSRGDKCVHVNEEWKADVVPAVRVVRFDQDPVAIFSFKDSQERLNWPRVHYTNGVEIHDATGKRFKPLVRMFKNWAANHWPHDDVAPSFYVECLISNVIYPSFQGDFAEAFFSVGAWIIDNLPVASTTKIMTVARDKGILTTTEWRFDRYSTFWRQLGASLILVRQALRAISAAEATRLWRAAFNE